MSISQTGHDAIPQAADGATPQAADGAIPQEVGSVIPQEANGAIPQEANAVIPQEAGSAVPHDAAIPREIHITSRELDGPSRPRPVTGTGLAGDPVDLREAGQLELAIHDARVAFDCIALDDLNRAHTSAITARAAIDGAENMLRASLSARNVIAPEPWPTPEIS